MKKISISLLLILLCSCNITEKQEESKKISVSGKIVLTDDNGNADIDITNTDFLNSGFNYGDSVNVEFENGNRLDDIPFLSGMYIEYGLPMVYGKASKDKVSFIQKYKSFVENNDINEQMSYTITINEKSKYSNIEEVGNLNYTNNFEDYDNAEIFANFREVNVGNIKQGRLYRSSSIIDNSANRSKYATKLASNVGIKTILNVKDKQEAYEELLSNVQIDTKKLIENTNVILAPISNDYQAEKNIITIINGLCELNDSEYPYLIHCLEGKDRIGYELAIIEALCGASYEEIVDDYMISYENLYGINKRNKEKYNYIKETNIDAMLKFITSSNDLENVNYMETSKTFLINYGMSEDCIDALIHKLCD